MHLAAIWTPRNDKENDGVNKFALTMLSKLEDEFNHDDASPETFERDDQGGVNAIGNCLKNELLLFNRLTKRIRTTLKEMLRALKGLVVMSEEIEIMERSLSIQQVPALWTAAAYPSLKALGGWVADYFQRINFIGNWLKMEVPSSFWITSFFFPQGFISSVKQTFARNTMTPIDQVRLNTIITKLGVEEALAGMAPDIGVYVHGTFLQGCGWDEENQCIRESKPGEIFCKLPVIHLEPYDFKKDEGVDMDTVYICPLYKTSLRWGTLTTTGHSSNFVMPITLNLSATINKDRAQRMGVAMMMSDD